MESKDIVHIHCIQLNPILFDKQIQEITIINRNNNSILRWIESCKI